ncbi:MAG TPA: S24 family peptidase, partial [Stellaceae bacterium]|nr:S24 family peptidase [Stellaceae bacterium]
MEEALDPVRHYLVQMIKARRTDLATVSRRIGRNHAYLHQFIHRGTPKHLPEEVRAALGELLGVRADEFRPQAPVMELHEPPAPFIYEMGSVRVDELDVRASAGDGALVEREKVVGRWELPRDLLRLATRSAPEHVKILTVVGDSMLPTFQATDKVMVDTHDLRPTPPGIFVIWDGLGFVLKRVEHLPHSEPPKVRLSSDNPKYQPYERVLGEAYIQGRVIGKWW